MHSREAMRGTTQIRRGTSWAIRCSGPRPDQNNSNSDSLGGQSTTCSVQQARESRTPLAFTTVNDERSRFLQGTTGARSCRQSALLPTHCAKSMEAGWQQSAWFLVDFLPINSRTPSSQFHRCTVSSASQWTRVCQQTTNTRRNMASCEIRREPLLLSLKPPTFRRRKSNNSSSQENPSGSNSSRLRSGSQA